MDVAAFKQFLKRSGRSTSAARRAIQVVQAFAEWLVEQEDDRTLDAATVADLEAYAAWLDAESDTLAKRHLWGLRYYFEFTGNDSLAQLAGEWRQQRIRRTPFKLKDFRGVSPAHAEALAAAGIENVAQMREAGRTPAARKRLAAETGVLPEAILELVKLSDLARVPGLKGIRARLYHDAGIDTVEKLAAQDPDEMRARLIAFVQRTGFDGIAPLPKEAQNAVRTARKLPRLIDY
jgi:predicted flap endonuclease-1-like 5' DNA nuclease